MQKIVSYVLSCLLGLLLTGCYENDSSAPDMVDPWLRERTPVSFRLESQIGAAVITDDWRHDDSGAISVQLVLGSIADMSRVQVTEIEFAYNATASVRPGSTLDLSSGGDSFVVTAENGEQRTYTVTYTVFKEPFEGVYVHDPIAGILDGTAPKSSMVVFGGWDGGEIISTAMDKSWHWGDGYTPADEEDNIVSIRLSRVDGTSGTSYGTCLNLAGDDGKWANYLFQNNAEKDVNSYYRIVPKGKSRWSKDSSGTVSFYEWEDAEYAEPLYTMTVLEAGTHGLAGGKTFTVNDTAFGRGFPGPYDWEVNTNWDDDRWLVHNIRNTFWTMLKSSDSALENHTELLEAEY